MKKNRKVNYKWIKVILGVIGAIVIFILGTSAYYKLFMDPYRHTVENLENSLALNETLSYDEALKDMNYFVEHLKDYHPAYLDGSEQLTKQVEAQYEIEKEHLKEGITVLELWQATSRIAAKLKDGHTNPYYKNASDYKYISDFTQLKEYEVPIAINGINVDEIFESYKQQYSYELEAYAESMFYQTFIVCEEYLKFCQVDTRDGVTFTYHTNNGNVDYHYDFVSLDKVKGYKEEEETGWVYYEINEEKDLGIFTLKTCDNNEEYATAVEEFFREVKEKNIHNIALDLRNNGGGNSYVANVFLEYVNVDTYKSWDVAIRYAWYLMKHKDISYQNKKKENAYNGNIYVLTDVRTYSSAMDFAMLIKDNKLGKIVGEASGNLPASYGDCLSFQLPHSKLGLSISFKKWYRVDKSKGDQPLEPDYSVPSQEALDKVYEIIK